MNWVVALTRSGASRPSLNIEGSPSETVSATAIIQLPRSARLIHWPPTQRPLLPSGPPTSTILSILLLSDDQVHAWHLPHQKSASGLKKSLLLAILSKPSTLAPKIFAALSSAVPGVWVFTLLRSSGES